MCNKDHAILTQELNYKKKSERSKFWELDHIYHCAVIGTCLSLAEVKKLLHSLQINCSQWTAYDIHTTTVTMVACNDFRSKKVQRYLDKKFSTVIQKTKKMNAKALRDEWKSVLNSGDLVATFWAIVTHPEANSTMRRDVYGDIHMLSHLSGASNRVDLKRLNQIERELVQLTREISFEQTKNDRLKNESFQLKKIINDLEHAASDLKQQLSALQADNMMLVQLQNTKKYQTLNLQLEKLNRKMNVQAKEINSEKKNREESDYLVAQLKNKQLANTSEISIYKEEVIYLQSLLNKQKKSNYCQFKKQNLCGQCVLYVGGKKSLIPYYRELIEESAGIFLHHDGGQEKNTQDLSHLLSRADIVLFPSDCISHDAYWKIKRSCKKQQKQYEYLNSPGLCSLSSMLNKLGITSVRKEVVSVGTEH